MNRRRPGCLLTRAALLLAGIVSIALIATSSAAASGGPSTTSRLHVVAVMPRRATVPGDTPFIVRFSAPLAPTDQMHMPRLKPRLGGTWSEPTPTTLRFTPGSAYLPGTVVELTIPAGLEAAGGAVLTRAIRRTYRVGDPSAARLPELLADLGYLPLHFVTSHGLQVSDWDAQLRALYSPPAGRLVFDRGWPAELHSLWSTDSSLVLTGAVMSFESQDGLAMDGTASPQVWKALIEAQVHRQLNHYGYSYAIASEASPESLTVYHNGAEVLETPANTGIPSAPTAPGTFPVYDRLRSQVMQGTNPDGSQYADYVQWVAYFNGGDAVHYMPRSGYGSPQSLGCVELPYAAAETAWGYLTYGTLVTVTG